MYVGSPLGDAVGAPSSVGHGTGRLGDFVGCSGAGVWVREPSGDGLEGTDGIVESDGLGSIGVLPAGGTGGAVGAGEAWSVAGVGDGVSGAGGSPAARIGSGEAPSVLSPLTEAVPTATITAMMSEATVTRPAVATVFLLSRFGLPAIRDPRCLLRAPLPGRTARTRPSATRLTHACDIGDRVCGVAQRNRTNVQGKGGHQGVSTFPDSGMLWVIPTEWTTGRSR